MKTYQLDAPPGPSPIEEIIAMVCEGTRDMLDGDPWIACGSFGEAGRRVDELLAGEGRATVPKPESVTACMKLLVVALPQMVEAVRWELAGKEAAAKKLLHGKASLFWAIEKRLEEIPAEGGRFQG